VGATGRSIGYFQKFPAHLAGPVRHCPPSTGGGLVYHGNDTTFTVVVPSSHRLHKLSTTEAYCAIHKAVAAALTQKSQISNLKSSPPRDAYECFQQLVAGDVVADGHKLAGGAQRRNRDGMLHQG